MPSGKRPTQRDPRRLGGGLAGPGGPHDKGQTVIDTRGSVVMDHVSVAKVDNPSDGRSFFAMALAGRINHSSDRAEILFLFDEDGATAILSELVGVAARWPDDEDFGKRFVARLQERLNELP